MTRSLFDLDLTDSDHEFLDGTTHPGHVGISDSTSTTSSIPDPREAHADEPTGEFHLLGPPGCGKTFALTQRWIPKAIARFGADAVAVCSLTNAAANEIASRQRVPLDPMRVSTLHGMARQALSAGLGEPVQNAQSPKNLTLWNAHVHQDPHLALPGASEVGSESSGREQLGMRQRGLQVAQAGPDALQAVEILRHTRTPEDDWPDWVFYFWRAWRTWKYENELHDFTDLIEKCVERGIPAPTLRGEPVRALFGDEAQDFSTLSAALFRQWGADAEVFVLAGDPNQNIFGFAGTDNKNFHVAGWNPERTVVLGQSYRLPPAVQEEAERFLLRSTSRVPLEYAPRKDPPAISGVFTTRLTLGSRDLGNVANLIEDELDMLADEEGDDNRVTVLAHNSYTLAPLLSRLKQRGIIFHNPFAPKRGDWNPIKAGKRHVLGLVWGARPDLRGDDHPPRLWTWKELQDWAEVCTQKGLFLHGAKANIIKVSAKARGGSVMDSADLDRVFADAASVRNELVPMLRDPARDLEAVQWLAQNLALAPTKRLGYMIDVARSHGIVQLSREPRVVVGTLHSIKGATSGSVLLCPELTSRQVKQLKGSSDKDHDQIIQAFYVGMTRSSSRLHLLSAGVKFRKLLPHVTW